MFRQEFRIILMCMIFCPPAKSIICEALKRRYFEIERFFSVAITYHRALSVRLSVPFCAAHGRKSLYQSNYNLTSWHVNCPTTFLYTTNRNSFNKGPNSTKCINRFTSFNNSQNLIYTCVHVPRSKPTFLCVYRVYVGHP